MSRIPSPDDARESPRDNDPLTVSEIRPVDDGRERQRTGNANVDPFEISDIMARFCPGKNRPGWLSTDGQGQTDFEWKRYEVYGRADYAEKRSYEDQGWREVPHGMFPGRFSPVGTPGAVVVKDMILMERPLRLTIAARRDEIGMANRAMDVHRRKMGEAPEGQAPRMEPSVRTSRETIQIPD